MKKKVIIANDPIIVDFSQIEIKFVKFYGDNKGLTYIVLFVSDLPYAKAIATALEITNEDITIDGEFCFIDTSDIDVNVDYENKCLIRTDKMIEICEVDV